MSGDRARMVRFEGTDTYVATQDLQFAVNAAITLEPAGGNPTPSGQMLLTRFP